MDEVPAVLLLHVLQFLDHSSLHAAEQTTRALRELTREHGARSPLPRDKPLHVLTFRGYFACLQSSGEASRPQV
jgi:hypothetical protein